LKTLLLVSLRSNPHAKLLCTERLFFPMKHFVASASFTIRPSRPPATGLQSRIRVEYQKVRSSQRSFAPHHQNTRE